MNTDHRRYMVRSFVDLDDGRKWIGQAAADSEGDARSFAELALAQLTQVYGRVRPGVVITLDNGVVTITELNRRLEKEKP